MASKVFFVVTNKVIWDTYLSYSANAPAAATPRSIFAPAPPVQFPLPSDTETTRSKSTVSIRTKQRFGTFFEDDLLARVEEVLVARLVE